MKPSHEITLMDTIFYKAFYSQCPNERAENFFNMQLLMFIIMTVLQCIALMFRFYNQEKITDEYITCFALIVLLNPSFALVDYLVCSIYLEKREKILEQRLLAPTIVWFFKHITVLIAIFTFDDAEKILNFLFATLMPNITFRIIPVGSFEIIYWFFIEFLITPYYAARNFIKKLQQENAKVLMSKGN